MGRQVDEWLQVIAMRRIFDWSVGNYRCRLVCLCTRRHVVRCIGVLQVGDIQRHMRARLCRRHAVSQVRTNETGPMRFYWCLYRMCSRRARSDGLAMLRTWSMQYSHPWCYSASAAAMSERHHGLPGSQLHLCTRYILSLHSVVINN